MASPQISATIAKLLKPKHVTVVGGGYSVKSIDVSRLLGYVIAVNDSAVHLPRYDCAVTMDRRWLEYRWLWLKQQCKPLWARSSTFQNVDTSDVDWVFKFKNDNGKTQAMSEEWDALNGKNSGACALNLAYHLQPEHAWITGIDLHGPNSKPYWYPPYPWAPEGSTKPGHYVQWAKLMEIMVQQMRARGIHVTVVSNYRWSKSIPLVTTQEFMEMQRCAT